jgi:hypothetical protein
MSPLIVVGAAWWFDWRPQQAGIASVLAALDGRNTGTVDAPSRAG